MLFVVKIFKKGQNDTIARDVESNTRKLEGKRKAQNTTIPTGPAIKEYMT